MSEFQQKEWKIRMMKIVIIANNSNGLYLFRRNLINTLIERGNIVTALTPFDTDVDNLKNLGIELIETLMDRRGTNPIRDYFLLNQYKKELKRLKPDLVITYTIKPNVYGGMVCRKLKIPYVANITGLGSAFEDTGVLRKVVTMLNKIALKNANVVFFENNTNRDVFVENKIVEKEKTHVLPGAGVDLTHFCYLEYPNNKEFKFLFIGRVMKEKGVDELLGAMRRLRKDGVACSLDILGYYEENYKEKLDEAEREGWLHYHGKQSDVRPYIRACDCFVLPSYHEGMANTNLENASSGRPIITSNIPGCREAVIDGVSGFLCEPKSEESLYTVMMKIVCISREKRELMGESGRKHMHDIFDKQIVVNETIERIYIALQV